MASKVLTCSASSMVANKASLSPASLGSVPRSVFFPSPLKTSSSTNSTPSLVVSAQQFGTPNPGAGNVQYGGQNFGSPNPGVVNVQHGGQPFGTSNPGPVHTPWYTTEDDSVIRMRIDMPGLAPEELDVKVEGDMLVIKDLGRQIFSPYDTKIQLPPDCVKEKVQATLKNGVLSVSVPKRFPPPPTVVHIPVRTSF